MVTCRLPRAAHTQKRYRFINNRQSVVVYLQLTCQCARVQGLLAIVPTQAQSIRSFKKKVSSQNVRVVRARATGPVTQGPGRLR